MKPDVCKQYFSERLRWLLSAHFDACINDYMSCKINGDEWKMKPRCQNRLKLINVPQDLSNLNFNEIQLSCCVSRLTFASTSLKPKSHTKVSVQLKTISVSNIIKKFWTIEHRWSLATPVLCLTILNSSLTNNLKLDSHRFTINERCTTITTESHHL